ncbi:MAG: stage II sporulation protein M [Methanocorpusculum sp.]|nr:stage II sporulation protein M [Methanocorpusculum sp.]
MKSWVWAVILAIGIIVGIISYKTLIPIWWPAIREAFDYIDKSAAAKNAFGKSFSLMIIIFLKNLSVAIICFLTAKLSKGFIPGFIMLINGMVIGMLGTWLSVSGMPVMSFIMGLLPHGIIELPALFLACAIGMYGINKESWRIAGIPALMLLVAAGIESYITPLLM